jgi:hypothetical protein
VNERQITDLIIDALVLDLGDAFDDVPDEEIAGVIRGGRLQDNPEKARISLTLHVGDPDSPNAWRDIFFARRDRVLDTDYFSAHAAEVGGGKTWWRRGAVKWEFFGTRTKEGREAARRVAGAIRARIERAIDTSARVTACIDDFGEMAVLIMSTESFATEGGGPPNQFIWRGKVLWQALTAKSY